MYTNFLLRKLFCITILDSYTFISKLYQIGKNSMHFFEYFTQKLMSQSHCMTIISSCFSLPFTFHEILFMCFLYNTHVK